MQAKYVQIGKIVAPHGVRGEVRVVQLSEFIDQMFNAKEFYIKDKGWLKVDSIREHKQFLLVKFTGIDNMDFAQTLRNKDLFLTREQIGQLPDGRYYIEDMLGIKVFDLEDNFLGILSEVFQTGSNDVYVVKREGKKDLLIPALKTVVKETNILEQIMIVNPPVWEDDN